MVDSPEIIQADLHKSIGGFIAEYSRFHGLLEYSAIYILSDGGKLDVADNASILISGLTTQALSKAIFSMIINARGGAWEDNEIDLIKKCRNEIDTLVATRNRFRRPISWPCSRAVLVKLRRPCPHWQRVGS